MQMSGTLFFSLLVNGLAMGTVYAMLGMGLILLIRAVGVLNFAQGDLLMFGAYICACLILDFELPVYLMIPVALVCFAILGLLFMFGVFGRYEMPHMRRPPLLPRWEHPLVLKEGAVLFGETPQDTEKLYFGCRGQNSSY